MVGLHAGLEIYDFQWKTKGNLKETHGLRKIRSARVQTGRARSRSGSRTGNIRFPTENARKSKGDTRSSEDSVCARAVCFVLLDFLRVYIHIFALRAGRSPPKTSPIAAVRREKKAASRGGSIALISGYSSFRGGRAKWYDFPVLTVQQSKRKISRRLICMNENPLDCCDPVKIACKAVPIIPMLRCSKSTENP